MYAWANVPPQFLEREIAPHAELAIWHLLVPPRLEILSLDVEELGEGRGSSGSVVHNTGWLPTSVSEKAVERKAVRPLEAELTLPEGARLHGGERRWNWGSSTGGCTGGRCSGGHRTMRRATARRRRVVEAPAGSVVQIEARHQRAGVVRRELTLE